ncbi:MAG: hypothetical protein JST26_18720 [Bacteroidetes bacterium]|nr:hypothetical protein [Bacteroidota bacterium]
MKIRFSHIFFSFALLLSMVWQCSAKSLIYLHYELNKKEIAANICENRMKPKSCCEGKCYLNKELSKEEKRQNDVPASLKDKTEKPSRQTTFKANMNSLGVFIQTIRFLYPTPSASFYFADIFHPPAVL